MNRLEHSNTSTWNESSTHDTQHRVHCPRPYPVFEVKVPKPGDYQVNFLYVANPNRSTKTLVTVSLGDVRKEIVVNQRESDGIGKSLGAYRIADTVTIRVSNHETDGFVVVDGVQLLPKQ